MNPFSLLLRVLLCISLIANGIGYAQASARMQFEHAAHSAVATSHGASPTVAADAGELGCHHPAAKAGTSPASHGAHASAKSDAAKHPSKGHVSGTPGADCCKGKTCNCACAHASCATTVASAVFKVVEHDVRVAPLAVGHRQPRLPDLIRPPIA